MGKKDQNKGLSRRSALGLIGAGAGVMAAGSAFPTKFAIGAQSKIKIGTLLPYSGTYTWLGQSITNSFELALAQAGGKLGGRGIELIKVDSEAKPPKAAELTNKLINQEKVDFIVGPVHSGVAMAMAKIAREEGTMTVIPNAGANQVTGPLCSPNIFRTSFSNWQPGHPMGKVLLEEGKKNVVLCYWGYGAGKQSAGGFKDSFVAGGGNVIKEIAVPFPKVEFQAALTEIASIKPDAVYAFFAGGGAVKFVKDWAAAGLKDKIELVGPGFLTEGVAKAQGAAGEGLRTTLHYADGLDNPANRAYRAAYKKTYGKEADVYGVQGFDAGQLIKAGVDAVQGDVAAQKAMVAAMEGAVIDSPRGQWVLSSAHNPVQNFYLRQVRNGRNEMVRVAMENLADPAKGCSA
ncbi:MAG: ABC transporter substrate-binding protein [Rhodospirillaceae bacterium]|jgi:branched-chain amino acid transport system substrate-binding protein|nr:ABC transporter substrate-binding protein [Rhodospirillaceae bacterium]